MPLLAEDDLDALLAGLARRSLGEQRLDDAVLGRVGGPVVDRVAVLDRDEGEAAADVARERRGDVGRARSSPRTSVCARACRAGGAASVPLSPATGSAARRSARSAGSFQISTSSAASSRAVTRSSRESPEPSTIRTPASGTPAARRSRRVTAAPAARRARPEHLGADRLQHHLGGEVVALVVHELRASRRAAPSRSSRAGRRPRARGPCRRAAGDDPARVEQPVERRGRRERRVGDEPVVPRGAVDDERRERRRLDPGERRKPAGRDAHASRSTTRRRRSRRSRAGSPRAGGCRRGGSGRPSSATGRRSP